MRLRRFLMTEPMNSAIWPVTASQRLQKDYQRTPPLYPAGRAQHQTGAALPPLDDQATLSDRRGRGCDPVALGQF